MQQDPWLMATVLTCLGSFYREMAQSDLSRRVLTEALHLAEAAGLVMEAGIALGELGKTVAVEGGLDEAISLMMDCILRLRETGNRVIVAHSLGDMGNVQRLRGDYETAHRLLDEELAFWQEFGSPLRETSLLCQLGFIAFHQGHIEQSESLFRDSLEQTQRHNERRDVTRNIALALIGLAKIAFWHKDFLRAIILLGAAHAQLQTIQRTFAKLTPADRNEAETLIPMLRQIVDDATYDRHFEDGKQMTLDQAVAFALKR
jgi:tetratricopeptide (TPR) repeat protein